MSRKVLLLLWFLSCLFEAYNTESITSKYPLPHIIKEQSLTVVVQGRTVVLQCLTTCDCPQKDDIKVSWLDNGHKVSMDSRTHVSKAGELSIRNVTSRSVGKRVFKCVASIGNWSVIGVERRIKVIDPLLQSIILQPTRQTLPSSGHASLSCKVDANLNLSKSTISWFKDGALLLLSNDTKYTQLPNGILMIHSLRRKDAGSYSCQVYSSLLRRKLVSNDANLTVVMDEARLKLPYFTHRPKDIEMLEGKTTAIHCSASGNPTPIVTISRELGHIMSMDLAKGVGFANLTLRNAKINDTGKYFCNIKSGKAKLQYPVWIKVLSPPKFISVPERRKLTLMEVNLSLSCVATGNPSPVITWYKNGKPLPMADKDIAEGKGSITITLKTKRDAGIYQCFATNKVGAVSHATFVFMEPTVRPPININAEAITHSRVKVTWQLNPLNNKAAVFAHVVSYECQTSSSQPLHKTKVMGTAEITESEIGPLLAGTEYSIYVASYGENGVKGARSEVVKVWTLENVPSIPPQPISVQNLGDKTMRVSWTPIPRKFAMGTVIRYKVKYGIAGIENKEILIPMGQTHVNISDLQIGELYTIEVSAQTSAGFGPAEKTTIKIGDPGIAARNGPPVEFTTVNRTAIRAHWKLKEDQNDITGFKLVYIPIRYADYWHEARMISLPPTANEYIISGLNPEKDYRIELRMISGPVLSKPSIVVYTRQRRKPIPGNLKLLDVSNPRELKCVAKGKKSLFLSWEKPLKNGDIGDYSVIIVAGGKKIKDYTPFRTRNLDYVLKDLQPGTWYYIKVDAKPRRDRIAKVQEQLKRAVTTKFESNVVACKTAEAAPSPPTRLYCNVTKDGHQAKVTWYPPMYPNGLVTNYVIRYRVRSKKYKMKWSIETLKLKPNNKGFPLEHQLKGDYYKTYEVEVIAVNSAGVGKSAKIQSCALKRRVERPLPSNVATKKPKSGEDLMSNDTILGIIVGCSIASLFIFTFIGVFIWKNPFRVKSLESQKSDANKANQNGMYAEDFLYLQRLAELRNTLTQEGSECSTRCAATPSGSNGRVSGDKDINGVSEPLMSRYHQTVMELTGSSSGQAVCTCTCLLHGRLRGKSLGTPEKREYTSTSTSTREDDQNHKNTYSNSSNSCSSGTSEGVDSAESADSRTKMLPKSDASSYALKDPSACTKAMHQKKKDTTCQV